MTFYQKCRAFVQAAFTVLGGWLGWFFGEMDGLFIALITFIALDYVTGVICAILEKKLNSEVGFKGIVKKCFILILVGVANILDVKVIGDGSAIRGIVICFYLSNEGVSLLENASRCGLPVPEKLKAVLAQLHKKGEGSEGN